MYEPDEEVANNPAFSVTAKGGMILNNDNADDRRWMESCYKRRKTVLNPIINWEDEDVWEFIHKYNIPYCELYDKVYTRLGCIGCPMSNYAANSLAAYPKYKQAYLHAFGTMLAERERAGKTTSWKTPEDVMKWWLRDREKTDKSIEGQMEIDYGQL